MLVVESGRSPTAECSLEQATDSGPKLCGDVIVQRELEAGQVVEVMEVMEVMEIEGSTT